MPDRIKLFVVSCVSRVNALPYAARLTLFAVPLIALVILGHHFGVLSKGNPGGYIPRGWRHPN
jgi:hypothetical protein